MAWNLGRYTKSLVDMDESMNFNQIDELKIGELKAEHKLITHDVRGLLPCKMSNYPSLSSLERK